MWRKEIYVKSVALLSWHPVNVVFFFHTTKAVKWTEPEPYGTERTWTHRQTTQRFYHYYTILMLSSAICHFFPLANATGSVYGGMGSSLIGQNQDLT